MSMKMTKSRTEAMHNKVVKLAHDPKSSQYGTIVAEPDITVVWKWHSDVYTLYAYAAY